MSESVSLSGIEDSLAKEVAKLLAIPREQVTPHTPLEDLGFDSLRLLELFVFIEKHFKIRLMEAPITRHDMANLGALARNISGRLPTGEN